MTTALNGLRSALFSSARAEPVTLAQVALAPRSVLAIRYEDAAEGGQFPSDRRARRQVRFELRQSEVPQRPAIGDTLTDGDGVIWAVKGDVVADATTGAWTVTCERGA